MKLYILKLYGTPHKGENAKFDFRYFDSDFANIEVENLNSWVG